MLRRAFLSAGLSGEGSLEVVLLWRCCMFEALLSFSRSDIAARHDRQQAAVRCSGCRSPERAS